MPLRLWVVGQVGECGRHGRLRFGVGAVCMHLAHVCGGASGSWYSSLTVCLYGAGPSDWDPGECVSGAGVTTSTASSCEAGSRLSVWPLLPLVLNACPFFFVICRVIWGDARNFFKVSSMPNVRLELRTLRSRVTCSADWASQGPQEFYFCEVVCFAWNHLLTFC